MSSAVLLAALAIGSPAVAANETPALETKLPTAHVVWCETGPQTNSFTSADDPHADIYLAAWVCDLLLNGKPGDINTMLQFGWETAVYVLYHEWWHTAFGEHDEKLTDCGSWAIFPYVLHRYWGITTSMAARLFRQSGYRSFYAPLPCGFGRP